MNDFEDIAYEDNVSSDTEPYDGGGWPGDGSGTDDLADYNANEADDYRNEGGEELYLDSQYEDANGCGYDGE